MYFRKFRLKSAVARVPRPLRADWRAAMDVLTSAASAHEAASEAQSSGETSEMNCEAQVLALKRKLIECDQQSRDQRERISGLEKGLDIEKREHQLTTSKLTMLLKKRGSSCTQYATAARTPAAVLASTPCVPRMMHPPSGHVKGPCWRTHSSPRALVWQVRSEAGRRISCRHGGV